MFNFVSNPMIISFGLPEGLLRAPEHFVGLASGVTFPRLDNPAQCVAKPGPNDNVNVRGHYNPGLQYIAIAVEELERATYNFCNVRLAQPTCANPLVQIFFHSAKALALDLARGLRRNNACHGLFALVVCKLKGSPACCRFTTNPEKNLRRQRICQTKCHEVAGAFPFYVRQVSASVDSRTERVDWSFFDSRCAKLKFDTIKARLSILREHESELCREAENSQSYYFKQTVKTFFQPRSADFQSAVSQTFSLPGVKPVPSSRTIQRLPTASRRYSRLQICATGDTSRIQF
jgi:hypothetical protein